MVRITFITFVDDLGLNGGVVVAEWMVGRGGPQRHPTYPTHITEGTNNLYNNIIRRI